MGTTAGSKVFAGKTLPDGAVAGPSDTINIQGAAKNLIYSWSPAQRKKWEQQLLDAGLIKPGQYNFADLVQMWQGAVEGAAALYTYGQKKVTPQQYVKNFLGVDGIGGKGSGGGPGGTQTNTQKSVTHFDDLDAQGAAMDVYSSMLGRAPKPEEVPALKAMLNAYAKAHPSITTQTTTTDAQGNSSTTSKSRGGVTAQGAGELAMDSVKAKPEYASYQAAATYYPLLEQALAGPGLDREF